jgi:hypothetical protein
VLCLDPFPNPVTGCLFIERRKPKVLPFVFQRRASPRRTIGHQPANARAAEKQKEKGCVGVAFYKQATTNVVEIAKENLHCPSLRF